MKTKAFTLAEAIIMIGILGIITAVTIPTLVKKDFKTDTNVRAASKAYSTLVQTVLNVAQDGYYYQHFDESGLGDNSAGIDVLTGKNYNGAPNPGEKFRDILLDSLYVSNVIDDGDATTFDTPDGIRWRLDWDQNTFTALDRPMIVKIDTNIKSEESDFECHSTTNCKVLDTVAFLVYRNGNVVIDGMEARATIGVNENGTTLGDDPEFNDKDFVKKVLGQYEENARVSNTDYYN